jgi:hypothetical protein
MATGTTDTDYYQGKVTGPDAGQELSRTREPENRDGGSQ